MMKKIVNGKEVVCSPEEEASIRAEWEANRKEQEEHEAQFGYIAKRKAEYPSHAEMVLAIVEQQCQLKREGAKLCESMDAIATKYEAINAKYPKPGEL